VRQGGATAWVRIGAERQRDEDGRDIALIGYVQELAQLDAASAALETAAGSGYEPAPPPPARPVMARKPAARVSAGVVLLVEDEDVVRNALGRMLGSLGFSVLEASTGDEALELIGHDQEDGIDLVVTDIRMPGVSGPDLAARIRAVRDVPVLFVSGYSADLAEEVRSARRTLILDKPFSSESLAVAIRTLLEQGA
jgi:CheY-like chemotaxis protein